MTEIKEETTLPELKTIPISNRLVILTLTTQTFNLMKGQVQETFARREERQEMKLLILKRHEHTHPALGQQVINGPYHKNNNNN